MPARTQLGTANPPATGTDAAGDGQDKPNAVFDRIDAGVAFARLTGAWEALDTYFATASTRTQK